MNRPGTRKRLQCLSNKGLGLIAPSLPETQPGEEVPGFGAVQGGVRQDALQQGLVLAFPEALQQESMPAGQAVGTFPAVTLPFGLNIRTAPLDFLGRSLARI